MQRHAAAVLALLLALPAAAAAAAPAATAGQASAGGDVRYSRDIRPILSDHCFACHGPDEKARKAKLRLDTKQGLLGQGENGPIVKPGDSGGSALFGRITAADPDERMPPAKHGKPLDGRQVEIIRRWIEQGAAWEQHWAFAAPVRPPVPE